MAAITTAVIAAAALAHQVETANQAKRQTEAAGDKQSQNQFKLEEAAKEQSKVDEANATRDVIRSKQKAMAGNIGGRSSTILTSPLGGLGGGAPQAGGKTLLGA